MVRKFWNSFLEESGCTGALKGTISFGNSREAAAETAQAIADGKKTAMSYPANGYRTAMKGMPAVGDKNIIVDWMGEPVCVIETVKVSEIRFCDLDEAIRAAEMLEGEDWKERKEGECKRELEELGAEFDENTMLYVEEFRSIFAK